MVTTTKSKSASFVYAREAIVINVGGRSIAYGQIIVIDGKTNEPKTIDNHNNIVDEGDEGVPYAFKPHQKVHKSHPAVEANPGAFMTAEEAGELGEEID